MSVPVLTADDRSDTERIVMEHIDAVYLLTNDLRDDRKQVALLEIVTAAYEAGARIGVRKGGHLMAQAVIERLDAS